MNVYYKFNFDNPLVGLEETEYEAFTEAPSEKEISELFETYVFCYAKETAKKVNKLIPGAAKGDNLELFIESCQDMLSYEEISFIEYKTGIKNKLIEDWNS
jgi:hypothetical protein